MNNRTVQLLAALCLTVLFSNSLWSQPAALLFVIDGLQPDAAAAAITKGAVHLKFFRDHGVCVKEAYCVSPAPRLQLPGGSLPWGTSSPPNVAMHTGTHVFESRQMDDIFLAARRAGIKSVFSGGAENYKEFNTADYCHYSNTESDSTIVRYAIDRMRNDGVRLIRVHIQRIRGQWTGPEDKTRPDSRYQKYLLHVDHLLEMILQNLHVAGLWDSVYVIIAGDHGMGMTSKSDHPASVVSSWKPYMNFYGPGIKEGETIPYAESPDIALFIAHVLGLGPLQGHTDPNVSVRPKGTTGKLLTNLFEGNPRDLPHHGYIKKYLESVGWKPSDDYAEYRAAMLKLVARQSDDE